MYTAYIGRRLVSLLNARENQQRSVAEFFNDVYYPLFFDNDRYLQHVNNSKFDQAYKQKGKKPLTAEVRAAVLAEQHNRIQTEAPDGSFFLGGSAAEATAGTSGQVTDLQLPITTEEVYASWIGAALGMGVSGGLNMLLDADEVLLALYEGWRVYRKLLTDTPSLKPHQINTWNGWWITTAFGRRFNPDSPMAEGNPPLKTDKTSGTISLETQPWATVVFALARKLPRRLTGYVYALSQMNTTVGFILLELPGIVRVERDLQEQLFSRSGGLESRSLDALYNTEMGFHRACELGRIGIAALKPEGLTDYMSPPFGSGRKVFNLGKKADENAALSFLIYKTWLLAMLNKPELWEEAGRAADLMLLYEEGAKKLKSDRSNQIDELLKAGRQRAFLEAAFPVMKHIQPEASAGWASLCEQINLMTMENFPYFHTLIKLRYAEKSRDAQQD